MSDPTIDIIAHLSRRDMEKALAACDAIQASTARITAIVAEAKPANWPAFKRELGGAARAGGTAMTDPVRLRRSSNAAARCRHAAGCGARRRLLRIRPMRACSAVIAQRQIHVHIDDLLVAIARWPPAWSSPNCDGLDLGPSNTRRNHPAIKPSSSLQNGCFEKGTPMPCLLFPHIRSQVRVMQKQPQIDAERLRDALDYDPTTGIFLRKANRGGQKIGAKAGTSYNGRRTIMVYRHRYYANVLALGFTSYGEWPNGIVDHKNNDPL